ncbi:MAG: hypothetical protein U0Q18_01220 [Bryobacteraceae bacterium]
MSPKRFVHRAIPGLVFLCLSGVALAATDCSNLPTQFTGNEFPTGDFFTNFNNTCYTIRLPQGDGTGGNSGDVNSTYNKIFFKVDPRYELILLGEYPNARYFSVSLYDEHSATSQWITDENIAPLSSKFKNPFVPGVPFVSGQRYAIPITFGGTPGNVETGCSMTAYNVAPNTLDATQRHDGMNWNTDPNLFQAHPYFAHHVVDTPTHSNPNTGGAILIRSYVSLTVPSYTTNPHIIVRDVASGCAYPADYVLNTLMIVSTTATWIDPTQVQNHKYYDNQFLANLCYGLDPNNRLSWVRGGEYVTGGNPDSTYVLASVPAGTPANLASAGRLMRVRVRIPTAPPTPCASGGCSRSGTEQMRYMSLSFQTAGGITLASLDDAAFTKDVNGYATLIVGTGAAIPSWVTPANGYTFVDLTTTSSYQNLSSLFLRNILPAATFQCAGSVVPYNTSVYTPAGGLMGDYLPVVDYPVASSLPKKPVPLVGPNACGVFPVGQPAVYPSCGVVPSGSPVITTLASNCAAPGCNEVFAQSSPPITVNGSGFGLFPNGLPFSGKSAYLEIIDSNQGWNAGYTGSSCNVFIDQWIDSSISLVATPTGTGSCPIEAGDQLTVKIWNPQTMATPITTTVTAAPQ